MLTPDFRLLEINIQCTVLYFTDILLICCSRTRAGTCQVYTFTSMHPWPFTPHTQGRLEVAGLDYTIDNRCFFRPSFAVQ